MPNYFWLCWLEGHDTSRHKHWALLLTYEEDEEAFATVYQVCRQKAPGATSTEFEQAVRDALPTGEFQTDIARRVQLMDEHDRRLFEGRMLLGIISDQVVQALEGYAREATEVVNQTNKKSGKEELNGQDWAMLIIRSFEDARFVPQGTLQRVEHRAPRR